MPPFDRPQSATRRGERFVPVCGPGACCIPRELAPEKRRVERRGQQLH